MLQTFKRICCLVLLVASGQLAWGFALLGPAPGLGSLVSPLPTTFGDTWEAVSLGYGLPYLNTLDPGGPVWLGNIGGPKNIGEEYRRNIPVLYYAYDANFSGFFGAQGETNTDQAFALMNNIATNHVNGMDGYSPDLSEFPLTSQHFNSAAENLYLTDIKSVTLHLLVEQMGLAEPERYTWTLHDRFKGPKCPLTTTYVVVQRNFGTTDLPLTGPNTGTLYTPYVNDVLYTYGIADDCDGHPPAWSAITIPFAVDMTAAEYTSVAANDFEGGAESGLGGLAIGGYYTGLTRDDAAGLRYLLTTTNINWETPGAGSLYEATNDIYHTTILMTSNLTDLVLFAMTNAPAVVETNFPGVVVGYSSNYWTVLQIPNVVAYYTNFIGSPAGSPPVLVVATNGFTPVPFLNYVSTFANVVTNSYSSNTVAYLQTIQTETQIGSPAGSPPVTNITYTKVVLTNVPSGDYYVIPPGTCGFNIVSPLYTNVTLITNIIQNIATAATNVVTTSNTTSFFFQQNLIRVFTNHWYVVEPCSFVTNDTGYYRGIEQVKFVRVPDGQLDPLTRQFLTPITNTYTMSWYNPTNYTVSTRTFQRIVTAPDILMTASDQAVGPAGNNFNGTVTRDILFNDNNILPGLAGPGTIEGRTTFDYNKVGTAFWNGPFPDTNSFVTGETSAVNETTAIPSLLWASYDGSTNLPIVYPNSLSIQQLESQMIITVLPATLADGTNSVYYSTTFTATGTQAPLAWSLAGTTLPAGLTLDPVAGVLSGTPSGNPSGIYDFNIQMTDAAARVVTLNYSITIH